jgi:hypothetical protein
MKKLPFCCFALGVVLHMNEVIAADSCPLKISDIVSNSSKVVTVQAVSQLPKRVSVRDAVAALGSAAVDAGSGHYVFVWHMEDGNLFSVSTVGDLCAPSMSTNIVRSIVFIQ